MLLVLFQKLRSFVLFYERDELYNDTVPFWSQSVIFMSIRWNS